MENYIRTEYEIQDPCYGFSGTSLQGYTDPIGFYDLVELFGKPSSEDAIDEKVNVEWLIEGKRYYIDEYGDEDWDYVKATIYNWKTSGVPFGEYGWHIGGNGWAAIELVEEIIKNKIKPTMNWMD
tara:strand:+ start:94 stop:468 length:375 start_codon:yes stop_codon:yes gene_type:complete